MRTAKIEYGAHSDGAAPQLSTPQSWRGATLTLGVTIAALNGLFWAAMTACGYALLGHAQAPLVLLGVWLVATYFSGFAVRGIVGGSPRREVSKRDRTRLDDARETFTPSVAAYAPDAAPRPQHSTR